MAQNDGPRTPRRPRRGAETPAEARKSHLRLLPSLSPLAARPLPAVVPLLQPGQPITPAQDALLNVIAQRARLGDDAARDLLWRAFAARLEPAVVTIGRRTRYVTWPRRNGRPWDLDDLRQEAWLVFVDLTMQWDGEGSFVPYITAYFPWRLRNAMRRIAPPRPLPDRPRAQEEPAIASLAMIDALEAALTPLDEEVLRLRLVENAGIGEIARRFGVNRRTVSRRWARICRLARQVLHDS